jgi:hypothetical protein
LLKEVKQSLTGVPECLTRLTEQIAMTGSELRSLCEEVDIETNALIIA